MVPEDRAEREGKILDHYLGLRDPDNALAWLRDAAARTPDPEELVRRGLELRQEKRWRESAPGAKAPA